MFESGNTSVLFMLNKFDILNRLIAGVCLMVFMHQMNNLIPDNTIYDFLLWFVFVIVFFRIHKFVKDKKVVTPFIKEDMEKLGYIILSERALTIKEVLSGISRLEFKVSIIQGFPYRLLYKSFYSRVFVAVGVQNQTFELKADIETSWSNRNKIDIYDIKPIDSD